MCFSVYGLQCGYADIGLSKSFIYIYIKLDFVLAESKSLCSIVFFN